ncbi:MAG: hypothetical protein KBB94_06360 [Legionellaceae bacterium]|nr:hypothetical protein [Legionellaceae bacterium]MBP9775761.1 hypothetical protein [Legionellaceae bacterium]
MKDDDSIEIECSQFMQKYMIFSRTKPHFEPLSIDFMNHAIRTISSLTHNRPDLTETINAIVTTTKELIPGIHNQQTLDHIANALMLTTQYVDGKIPNKEVFESRLKTECNIIMQKHQKYTIVGYTLATAIAVSTLAIGCALPYVALACVLAAAIAGLTYQHTNDPHLIIGDKLSQGDFKPSAPPEKHEPDILSQQFGI